MTGQPPLVVAHVRDLLFSSRIGETARRLGYGFRATRTVEDLRSALGAPPALVMLDLGGSGQDVSGALREIEIAGRPAPVLGWTTHVLWKTTKPHHEGCDRVVTKETLTEELPALLRGYVEGGGRAGGATPDDAGGAERESGAPGQPPHGAS